jgi:phospholipid/cholesterol/gamma-HCH transport system substrate-binding protein
VPSQQQVKWSQLRVGITVLVAGITLAVLVFAMSGTVSPFSHKLILRSYFENAAGLVKGAPVRLSGVDIGNVDRIGITHDSNRRYTPVEVVMKISARHQNEIFRGDKSGENGSRATLATQGVLGSTFVDIDSSRASGPAVRDGDELKTTETPALQDVLKSSQGSLEKLNVILDRTNDIVTTIQNGQGSVGKLINDPELYDRATGAIAQLQTLANQVTSGKGSIGKLLYSEELYDKLNDAVTKITTIADDINSGKGNLGKLLKDEQLYKNLNDSVAKLNNVMSDVEAGRGTLGKFAKDQQYAEKIDRLTTNLEKLSDELATGKGSLGKAFNDPSLYNNADQMLLETRYLVKALRENPKKYLTIHFKVF